MTTLSDADLLRLAEDATPEFIGGDRVGDYDFERECQLCGEAFIGAALHTTCDGCDRQEAFRRAANPSRIKSLLSEKAELEREVERLRDSLSGWKTEAFEAAQVAFNRGAEEWAALNYPQWIEAFRANQAARVEALSPNNPAVQAMEKDHG